MRFPAMRFPAMRFPALLSVLPALLLVLTGPPREAVANDGYAEMAAGGLVFTEAPEGLRMAEEDLRISLDRIRVAYRFLNETGRPITARVAFPLPSISPGAAEDMAHDPGEVLSMDFTTTVDGRPVPYETERRAFGCLGGSWYDMGAVDHVCCADVDWDTGVCRRDGKTIEVTEPLDRHGLLNETRMETLFHRLEGLSPEAVADLSGAVTLDPRFGPMPNWSVRVVHHREQTFPPGQMVSIVHEYSPLPGAAVWGPNDLDTTDTLWAVRYILTTAATWSGPIGRFSLTVAPASPQGVVAVAGIDGLVPDDEGTFRLERSGFVPAHDITVTYFPTRSPEVRDQGAAAYRANAYGLWHHPEVPFWLSPGALELPPGRFPGASLRALTAEELTWRDAADLAEMRNEIYARHGHRFRTERWRAHFTALPWYHPTGDASGQLSAVERRNIAIIQEAEQSR